MSMKSRYIAGLLMAAIALPPAFAGDSSLRHDNTSVIGDRTVPRVTNGHPVPNDICSVAPQVCSVAPPPPPPPPPMADVFLGAEITCKLTTTNSNTVPIGTGAVSCARYVLNPMVLRSPTFSAGNFANPSSAYSFVWSGCTVQSDPSVCKGPAKPGGGATWSATLDVYHTVTGQSKRVTYNAYTELDDGYTECPTYDDRLDIWYQCP